MWKRSVAQVQNKCASSVCDEHLGTQQQGGIVICEGGRKFNQCFHLYFSDYIMATGPTDVIQSPETGEPVEECTGKQ